MSETAVSSRSDSDDVENGSKQLQSNMKMKVQIIIWPELGNYGPLFEASSSTFSDSVAWSEVVTLLVSGGRSVDKFQINGLKKPGAWPPNPFRKISWYKGQRDIAEVILKVRFFWKN